MELLLGMCVFFMVQPEPESKRDLPTTTPSWFSSLLSSRFLSSMPTTTPSWSSSLLSSRFSCWDRRRCSYDYCSSCSRKSAAAVEADEGDAAAAAGATFDRSGDFTRASGKLMKGMSSMSNSKFTRGCSSILSLLLLLRLHTCTFSLLFAPS